MAKRYYWLKLKNDFFAQPRIKKLRKIAGGDTYTIIYLKMQLLSLADEGKLYFDGIEDDFAEEIALTIDEDVDNVKVTLQFLISQGLIEVVTDNEFLLTETQSLIGSEGETAERVRKYRASLANKPEIKSLQCNTDVTNCNTEIDIYIEKEKEKEKKNNICPFFENLWKSYPNKKGKNKVSKKALKEINAIGEDKMLQAIERYKKSIVGTDTQYIKHGSTFFNGDYVDYLQEEQTPVKFGGDMQDREYQPIKTGIKKFGFDMM